MTSGGGGFGEGGGEEGRGAVVPELLVKYPATQGAGPVRYSATEVEEMKKSCFWSL